MRLFEAKTGKKQVETGKYLTNLLNAEISRKGYFDADIAGIQPFRNLEDVQARSFEAYQLLRGYNEYPTMQQGEFMARLRFKMIEDEIPDEMQDAIENVYNALSASAAKQRGVDVDTFWQKVVGGVENATTSSQEWRALKQELGPRLTEFKHDAQGAIAKLKELQSGDAIAALHHPDVGDIDLIWGIAPSAESEGFGLAKLVEKHPEVVDNLQEVISSTKVLKRSPNRIVLDSDSYRAIVRLDYDGQSKRWLMTAYEKKGSAPFGRMTDVAETLMQQADTAPLLRDGTENIINLFQGGIKGETSFLPDSRALLRFFKGEANPSTYVHEAAHMFMPTLNTSDMDTLARYVGLDSGETLRDLHVRWVSRDAMLGQLPKGKRAPYQFREITADMSDAEKYVVAQEKFARGFEKYLAEGVAPNDKLAKVFESFKNFLLDLYHGITGSEIDVKLSGEMRALYAGMLDADSVRSPADIRKIERQWIRETNNELIQSGGYGRNERTATAFGNVTAQASYGAFSFLYRNERTATNADSCRAWIREFLSVSSIGTSVLQLRLRTHTHWRGRTFSFLYRNERTATRNA